MPYDIIGLSYYPKWHGTINGEAIFDRSGKSNELLDIYPEIAEKYLK